MALFLEITKGPGEGQKFRIQNGTRIGRSTGEILIQDPKVSALHAQVESDRNGQLFLIDRGSANGIRIKDQKVFKVAMMPGVSFRIGQSYFKVIEFFSDLPMTPKEPIEEGWKKTLKEQVPQMSAQNFTQNTQVFVLNPAIELEFIEGIQTDTRIVLGYGPRKAGSDVLDIELHDPESPDVAFEIHPVEDGTARFRTKHPEQVRLNDEPVSSGILRSGDRIRVGSTLIEVKFLI